VEVAVVWATGGVGRGRCRRQAEAASELGGRRPGATGCGGCGREKGCLYEEGQKRTSGLPSGSVVTVVGEKSGANSTFPANQITQFLTFGQLTYSYRQNPSNGV
jgi:hypothetical protein